ncbi:hypothetical protein EBB07_28400 [Paenibacillaceae bacterium]|nr:hypothetical protein EBB07_28400 [Paenibacillaceae bacterium]
MPDLSLIEQMIKAYSNAFPEYTLDAGVNNVESIFLIEAHSEWRVVGYYGLMILDHPPNDDAEF